MADTDNQNQESQDVGADGMTDHQITDPSKVGDPIADQRGTGLDPQPAPSTPTQPGGEPQEHPHDPIKRQDVEMDENGNPVRPQTAQHGVSPSSLKVKVGDNEYEIDEWARGLINKDNEKQFKRLYEKAYGLDIVVDKLKERTERLQTIEPEYNTITTALSQASAFIRNEQLGPALEILGIPKQLAIKYAIEELQYQDLPPEARAERDRQMQAIKRAQELEYQNQLLMQQAQQYQQQYEGYLTQTKDQELRQVMTRPDIAQIAQSFDQRIGTPGAFRRKVIQEALDIYEETGSDPTAEQAVQRFLMALGQMPQQNQGSNQGYYGQPQAYGQQGPQTISQGQGKPPVIPNVGGKNTSPTRPNFKSLDDLKKYAESLPG